MADSDSRPTAQEIEELIDLVRRDPGSPAFIDLSEAYLSLGRPRDAVQVCNVGLDASPDSLEGRVMLARAFASLHQWKEAQGELLRVVKVDRSNRQGFALLGEVLLRRSDYERAVPVLQHAQNLDPTSPHILSMLRRARAGQGLDPPPPVPTPIPPRGETDNGAQIQRGAPQKPPPRPIQPGPPPMVPTASPAMPTMAVSPAAPAYNASYDMASSAPSLSRAPKQTAPPPMSVEGIRPRVVSQQKQHNAAAASLRQSAAVGENYLNDLLTGGLLEVPGVRVADGDFDLRPDRRWGRSTRRAFIFLFVVLVLGIGGGGTWYWWSEKQKSEAITRLQKEAKVAIGNGTFDGLSDALGRLTKALEKDKDDALTRAYAVEVGGLAALLYGTPTDEVDADFKYVTAANLQPGEPGSREMIIGKAALELSRLHKLEPRNAVTTLAEVNKSLDEHLSKNPKDNWARWLKGRAMLAAGERKGARAVFETASEGDTGIVVAMIDRADLAVDDGKLAEGLELYKKADAKSKDHPLEVLGRSLGRAEASSEIDETIGELNDKFVLSKMPPRTTAYRWLARALANISIEDYPKAIEAIKKATAKPPGDPRFWARVAWVHYTLGDLEAAATARQKCVWYSKNPEEDPTVQLVDAGLLLASGLPQKALEFGTKIEGVRPRIIRAYALMDLGKPKEALGELDEVLKTAENNREAQILKQQARMLSTTGKERDEAAEALEKLARAANSKLGRHALGVAWLALGDVAKAKDPLNAAITEVSETSPNPLMYRTRTALAEIALAENQIAEAGKHLDEALKTNAGYFPTRAMQARVVLRNNEPDKAIAFLEPILKEAAAITPIVKITYAEALVVKKGSTAKDKEQAKALILEVKASGGIPMGELARVAALIDDDLPKQLELGTPSEAGAATPEAPPKKEDKKPRKKGRR